MERIGPVGSPGMGRVEAIRPVPAAADPQKPASRALVVIEGGRPRETRTEAAFRDGRAEAGFLTQLIVGADPTLVTSRPARARQAAARYAETARLVGRPQALRG